MNGLKSEDDLPKNLVNCKNVRFESGLYLAFYVVLPDVKTIGLYWVSKIK
jgi:hypothetical protein